MLDTILETSLRNIERFHNQKPNTFMLKVTNVTQEGTHRYRSGVFLLNLSSQLTQ